MSWNLLCALLKAEVHWLFHLHHTGELSLCHYFYKTCSFPLLLALPLSTEGQDIGVSPLARCQVSTNKLDAKWGLKYAWPGSEQY